MFLREVELAVRCPLTQFPPYERGYSLYLGHPGEDSPVILCEGVPIHLLDAIGEYLAECKIYKSWVVGFPLVFAYCQ